MTTTNYKYIWRSHICHSFAAAKEANVSFIFVFAFATFAAAAYAFANAPSPPTTLKYFIKKNKVSLTNI
jgi:hypothetical protein